MIGSHLYNSPSIGLGSEDPNNYLPRGVSAGDCTKAADALTAMRAEITDLEASLTAAQSRVAGFEAMLANMPTYDAGLLPEPEGQSDGWWQDAMRAELARAHDFYESWLSQFLTNQEAA